MLAKWIVADASNRAAFDEAQREWAEQANYEGFYAQMGGWIEPPTLNAGVLAIWRDFRAYREFMERDHDEVPDAQQETLHRISIVVASVIMRINQSDPRVLAETAEVVRVSDVTLEANSSPIFVARQMQIWNPALASADGMLGALICRADGNRDRFLAASFWRDRSALEAFRQELYPAISKRAGTETYIKTMIAYHFCLERPWLIMKWT